MSEPTERVDQMVKLLDEALRRLESENAALRATNQELSTELAEVGTRATDWEAAYSRLVAALQGAGMDGSARRPDLVAASGVGRDVDDGHFTDRVGKRPSQIAPVAVDGADRRPSGGPMPTDVGHPASEARRGAPPSRLAENARPSVGAERTDAAGRPGRPVSINTFIFEVTAYPFTRFSGLRDFRAAIEALPGTREVRVRFFDRGTIRLRVEYVDDVPFVKRLSSLPGFSGEVDREPSGHLTLRLGAGEGAADRTERQDVA